MGRSPQYVIENFPGIVVLKEWIQAPDGRVVRQIKGNVTIQQANDAVGFDLNERESNWFARITGPTMNLNILGCQVRAIYAMNQQGTPFPADTHHECLELS